jgi:hypothetical protein
MPETLPGFEDHLTFKGNLKDTRYGWLRLTPAYSVHLVADLLDREASPDTVVLDPYCGTGTTALVCAELGIPSITTDINPFLIWLACAKAARYTSDDLDLFGVAADAVAMAIADDEGVPEWVPALHQIDKWWDAVTLHALGRAMASIRCRESVLSEPVSDLLRLAFCRVLIERASVSFGHQSMSFKKRKQQELALDASQLICLVLASWESAVATLAGAATSDISEVPEILLRDARDLSGAIPAEKVDVVITSPPYPNRMSYIRELRPYMYWLGYLADGRSAGELDWQAIGGTWGCATSNVAKWHPEVPRPIPHPEFEGILDRIAERSELLSRYVHKYFYDMSAHLADLLGVLAPGATVHYIVGNSKFYDVVLPVQEVYAGLFDDAGFEDVWVEVVRKRSSKRELFEYLVSARKP